MGKVDDMRRLREEQHEAKQTAADKKAAAAQKSAPTAKPKLEEPAAAIPAAKAAPVAPKSVPAAKKSAPAKSSGHSDTGECSGCGKQKAIVNGMIANHQKGLGKICPGARKNPA